MKTTINKIEKSLQNLKGQKIEKLEKVTKELESQFIDNQLQLFNVDLSNKTATINLTAFITAIEFDNDMKASIKDSYKEESDDVIQYVKEVERIANKQLQNSLKPIRAHTSEMRKAIILNDLPAFNIHSKALLGVEMTQQQFNALSLMLITSSRQGLKTMGDNTFNNLFCHIMVARLNKSGSFSFKKVKGCLNKAIKDVPTITVKEAIELDTLTVEKCIKELGLSKRCEGDKYDYAKMKERVLKALHVSIAVCPSIEESEQTA